MLSVILDVLFFRSQISPTSRLNFHILKKVSETRRLEEIDYKIKTQNKKSFSEKNKIPPSPRPKKFFVTLNKTYFFWP